ncbi:hypothetical protein FJZ36_04725 [Candidatus Poribacteria bacterium]|nr:hypothetical protein [Candidatus Poribacteria bacterium]
MTTQNARRLLTAICLIALCAGNVSAADLTTRERRPAQATEATPAEELPRDPRLVAPYTAVVRSAILPGWGQVRIRERVEGAAFFVVTAGLMSAWFVSYRDFRDQYDHVYLPAVKQYGVTSREANAIYSDVNGRFKASRLLLFSALGVWGYSLIDAYVDANIFNAELRAEELLREGEEIRKLQFELMTSGPRVRIRVPF